VSRENVELVRRAYEEGWMDGDPTPLLALAHDQIRWINPADAVEPGVRQGREEFVNVLAGLRAAFDSSVHELREVYDAGDAVVAAVRFRASGRSSSAEAVHEEFHTWTFAEGKIVSFEWGRDLGQALRAVGLAE
jgi:ketosteroid isomerase-like protein